MVTKVMVTSEGFPHMSHHADGRGYPHFYPDVYHLSRGDVHQKEEIARVGYLQVLMHDGATPSDWQQKPPDGWDRTSFSRASLAHWITDPDRGAGALAARVAVNRLWHHHFGTGIVPTPNDFGFSGERPTHPELLDWLARDFIENGWSLKRMHKLLMTSQLYQQSSELDPAKAAIDPENRLLWRWRPRRLEAEAIRDSILAVSGLLDRTMFGPGTLDEGMRRRSIYFFIKRSQLIPTMMLFDWPEHLVSIGRRSSTTIAPQALAFLNSPHFRQMAEAFAAQLNGLDDRTAINTAWKKALSRPPTEDEQALAVQFLDSQRESYVATGAKNPGALARVDLWLD